MVRGRDVTPLRAGTRAGRSWASARRRVAAIVVAALTASLALVAFPSAAHADERVIGVIRDPFVLDGPVIGTLTASPAVWEAGDAVRLSLDYTFPSAAAQHPDACAPYQFGGRWIQLGWTFVPPDADDLDFRDPDPVLPAAPNFFQRALGDHAYVWSSIDGDPATAATQARLGPDTYSVVTTAPSAGSRPWADVMVSIEDPNAPCRAAGITQTSPLLPEAPTTFIADPVDDRPGTFWFQPDDSSGSHTWDFGDGTDVDTTFQPVHGYEKPGTYSVRHCRPDLGSGACTTMDVLVTAPTVTATVTSIDESGAPIADEHDYAVGDEVALRVRVAVDEDGVGTVSGIQPAEGDWLRAGPGLELLDAPEAPPASLDLDPGESFETVYRYTIATAGDVGAGTTIVGVDAADRPIEPIDAGWSTRVLGVIVTVETMWPGGGDPDVEPEFQQDNNGDGTVDDEDHRLTVTITVTNALDEPVNDVVPTNPGEPIDFRNLLLGSAVGMREDELIDYDIEFGDLAPAGAAGDSASVTISYIATRDVYAEAGASVRGVPDSGGLAMGYGSKEVRFGSHLAVRAELRVEDRPYWSGQNVRIVGSYTNLLADRVLENGELEEAAPVAVVAVPVTGDNAGGGYVFDASSGGPTPLGMSPIVVQPGETLDIGAILPTRQQEERTYAAVEYTIEAWELREEAVPVDVTRIDVVDDDTFSPSQRVGLAPSPLEPDGSATCGSVTTMLQNVSCNFVSGLINLGTGMKDLALMVPGGLATTVEANDRTRLWALHYLEQSFRALANDPAAQQRLSNELTVQLETWVQVGIMSRDALASVGGEIAGFIQEGDRVFSEGDYEAMTAYVSRFVGENPDLGLAAIAKVRAMSAIGRGIAVDSAAMDAAAIIAREANERAAREAAESVPGAVRQAVDQGRDPATAGIFRGGEDVTGLPEVYSGVYGAREVDLQNALDIAQAEDVLIAFRGRAPISQSLIDRALAWVKPMDVKTKNVNAIDVTYLGFPMDSYGRVELVTPPIDWRLMAQGLEGELQTAADAYMTQLRGRFPELIDDPLWADEVRARLIQRTKEFPKERINFERYRSEGIALEFGYGEQGLRRSLDHGVKEIRPAEVTIGRTTDAFGVERQVFQLKMAGPGGGDFRWITGDIDIVGILNADRTAITDTAKRLRVYESLRELLGMQHGETMTYINPQVQARLLRDHAIVAGGSTEGVEALMVAGPDRRVRAGFLEERLSTYEDVLGQTSERSSFQLISGGPAQVLTAADTGRRAAVASWESTWNALQRTSLFLLPGKWADFVDGLQDGQVATIFDRDGLVIRPDGEGGVEQYVPGEEAGAPETLTLRTADQPSDPLVGEIIAAGLAPDGPLDSSGTGASGGRWQPIETGAALAQGDPAVLDVAPIASLPEGAAAGTTRIEIATAAELGLAGSTPWFQPGDRVVIDPGTSVEEYATVIAIGSLVFDAPLVFDHLPGSTVALVEPAAAAQTPGGGVPAESAGARTDRAQVDGVRGTGAGALAVTGGGASGSDGLLLVALCAMLSGLVLVRRAHRQRRAPRSYRG